MKELITLLKKDLLLDYSFLVNWKLMASKRNIGNIVGYSILLLFSIVPIRFLMGLFDYPELFNLRDVLFAQLIVSGQIMVIFFFLSPIVSSIYFSNDVNILLSLPVKPSNIYLSKILNLTLSSLVLSGFIILPSGIKFGLVTGKGFIYYVILIIGWILTNLTTITILSFIIVIAMRFINKLPNVKTIFQTIGMIFLVVFSIGIQILVRTIDFSSGNIAKMLTDLKYLLDKMMLALPYVRPYMYALTENSAVKSLGWLLVLILISAAIVLGVTKFGYNLMIQGILDNKVISNKKKRVKNKSVQSSSPVMAIAKKDVVEILKTPVYIYNVLSMGILLPVIAILPMITSGDINLTDLFDANKLIVMLGLTGFDLIVLWMLAGLLINIVLGAGGPTSMSALSREGKSMWLFKVLPVKYSDLHDGKVIASMFLQLLAALPTTILLFIVLRPNLIGALSYILGALSAIFLLSTFSMALGIENVKLDWDNPQQIIKNTFSALVNVGFCLGYVFIFGYIFYNLLSRNTVSIDTAKLLLIGLIVLNFISGYLLRRRNVMRLSKKLITYGE